jgi:hypothetical protein
MEYPINKLVEGLYSIIFGERRVAIPKIKALVERTDNVFSYQNTLVCKNSDEEIKRLLLFYTPKKVPHIFY